MVLRTSDKVENTTSDGTGEDITDEIEVDEDDVKLYKIEELVPSSTPLTVPYLEIYRTNELEYIPYLSPYNVGVQSDSNDSDSSDTGSDTTGDGTDTGTGTDSTGTDTGTGTDSTGTN